MYLFHTHVDWEKIPELFCNTGSLITSIYFHFDKYCSQNNERTKKQRKKQQKKSPQIKINFMYHYESLAPSQECLKEIKYDISNIWTLTHKNLNEIVGCFLSSRVSREQWIRDKLVWCCTYLFNLYQQW